MRFFSIHRKRGASTSLTRYDLLEQTGEEPEYPNQATEEESGEILESSLPSMDVENGVEIPSDAFATPRPSQQLLPIDSISNASQPQLPTPEVHNAVGQNWLDRVSSTIRRKPTIKEAYKSGGIRSAWACTLPRNWKTRNAAAAKALADNATALDKPQLPRSMDDMDLDDEKRSPLPIHWREGAESRQAFAKRTSGIASCDSELGDWNSPRESGDEDGHGDGEEEVDPEFRDWANQYKMLVEQYDPLADASKRASTFSKRSKQSYSDYFRES